MRWRIGIRAATGGHDIPPHVLGRRFRRSLENAPRLARIADVAYFLDNGGNLHRLVAANRGVLTFLDPEDARWVELATAGLPLASVLTSREEALTELREPEGMTEELRVRDNAAGYTAVELG